MCTLYLQPYFDLGDVMVCVFVIGIGSKKMARCPPPLYTPLLFFIIIKSYFGRGVVVVVVVVGGGLGLHRTPAASVLNIRVSDPE